MTRTRTPKQKPRGEPPPIVMDSPLLLELERRDARIRLLRQEVQDRHLQIALELRAIERTGLFAHWGFTSITDYARQKHGLSSGQTSEYVAVGRASEELPPFQEAVESNRISYSQARKLAPLVGTAIDAGNLPQWLEKVQGKTVTQIGCLLKQREDVFRRVLELTDQQLIHFDAALDVARKALGTRITQAEGIAFVCQKFVEESPTGGTKRRILVNLCGECGKTTRTSSVGPIEIHPGEALAAVDAGAEVVEAEGDGKIQKHVPAAARRKAEARSQGFCAVPACMSRVLELQHPDGRGAGHDQNQLSDVCRAHHMQEHGGYLIREGKWPHVSFRLRDGTFLGMAGDRARAPLPPPSGLARASTGDSPAVLARASSDCTSPRAEGKELAAKEESIQPVEVAEPKTPRQARSRGG